MNFNLKSFSLASMAIIALLKGSTAAVEGSNQLRGVNRQLQELETGPTYIPPTTETSMASGSISDTGTGSTYTAPTDKCPVQITLDSSKGGKNVSNGSCRDAGGACAYRKDNLMYAQCDCVNIRGNNSEWQCYPKPDDGLMD